MNYFFGLSNSIFKSSLTIPKFQNNGHKNDKYSPFEITISNNEWLIKKCNFIEDENFFFLDDDIITNENFFFLSNNEEVDQFNLSKTELYRYNDFTNTQPVNFRSNLRISYKNRGFSSYQSEYPFEMTQKNGNVLSSIFSLLNSNADENYILFRNIFKNPTKKKFNLYLINIKKKEILNFLDIFLNNSNLIFIDNKYINENTYLLTDNFIGIPIFISLKDNHLSMEHTHPPHHYVISDDKFKVITKLKNEIKAKIIQ